MNVVFIVLSKPSVKRQDRVRREDNEKRFDEFFSELSTEKLVWVLRKVADSTEEYERLRVCFILLASKEYFFSECLIESLDSMSKCKFSINRRNI